MQLTPGANAPLPTATISVSVKTGKSADISSFRLYGDGKTKSDPDFVFYGQKNNDDNTVSLTSEGLNTVFNVDLTRLKPDVQRIAFTATVDAGTIASLGTAGISVTQGSTLLVNADVPMTGRSEAALILGELYRRNNEWKFRFVCQGFNGGLAPLAEHFGVDIAANSQPSPTPQAAPEPASKPINLSKITLTKSSPSISLEKRNNSYGMMKVNLNWNQKGSASGGFFGFGKSKGIDLDLGAFVRLKNGQKGVVQALGNSFGSYGHAPFVELQGDDRTGAVSDGEWLHINGGKWDEIDEVLIYTFIYEGVPNWAETDGIVTLHMPNQPPIETHLTEGQNKGGMCAIARLLNVNGQLKVERINQFYTDHKPMDEAFGWGFRWSRGSK
nr:TerD family protein [synthetic construct]